MVQPGQVRVFEAGEDGIEVVLFASETAGAWMEPGARASESPCNQLDHWERVPAAMLFVARVADEALVQAYMGPVGAYGLGIFGVSFREPADDESHRIAAAEAILRCCKAIACGFAGVRYVETDISLDAPFAKVWRAALSSQAFQAIAESYNYTLDLQPGVAFEGFEQLHLQRCDELATELVYRVYEAAFQESGDQAHRFTCEPYDVRLKQLMTLSQLRHDRAGWLIGFEGDQPIGLVLASMEESAHQETTTGIIVELGVVPEARGRGMGRLLLKAGLDALAAQGARRVFARIDAQNAASWRLLSAIGFVRQPGGSWVYQWRVPGEQATVSFPNADYE